MRNLSVKQAIIEYLKTNPGSKPATIKFHTNKPMNQVYTMLGKLVKEGVLKRKDHTYRLVNTVPMTTINTEDTAVVEAPKPIKASDNPVITVMKKNEEILRLKEEISTLQEQVQDVSVKYYDALAVISYLEKLFNIKK